MTNQEIYNTFLGCIILFAIGIGGAFANETKTGNSKLAGYWVGPYRGFTVIMGFVSDGRYSCEMKKSGAQTVYESGKYQISGDELTFNAQNGETVVYGFQLSGNKLILTSESFDHPITLTKQSGSEKQVIEDLQQASAKENEDDDAWRQRIPVAPKTGRSTVANGGVGKIPRDPNPSRVLQKPTVFTKHEVYWKLGEPQTLVLSDGSRRTVFDEAGWYFYPEGRIFVHSVFFYENGPPKGQLFEGWGRYTVQPGGAEEAVTIELDSGEKHTLTLIDGRRNLIWREKLYSNLEWMKQQSK